MSKRVVSKEFIDSDSDNSDEGAKGTKKTKKEKTVKKDAVTVSKSDDVKSWTLSKQRKVTVDEFRGKKLVSIREYYTDKGSGEEKPGRKGISLTVEQWNELVKVVEDVNKVLQ